jgi:predicted phosphodiesterase
VQKTLIFADMHGNFAALEAVLAHEQSWTNAIFLGDAVVHGPQPEEVMQCLMEMKGLFVMGNHDEDVLKVSPTEPQPNTHWQWIQWVRNRLSPASVEFLRGLSAPCSVEEQGLGMHLTHAVPEAGKGGRLWPDAPDEVFAALGARLPEGIIVMAHSHVQFRIERMGRTFVNPGAVGQQRLGRPLAAYAVIEDGALALRAVPYDTEKTCRAMDDVPLDPGFVQEWKTAYRTGTLPTRYNIRDFSTLISAGYI